MGGTLTLALRRVGGRAARSAAPSLASAGCVTVLTCGLLLSGLLFIAPPVSADSWTESSQQDFLGGSLVNLVATPDGSLQLGPNGTLFGNAGVVIPNGPSGSADSVYARTPFVLREADGTYKMWYTGEDGQRFRMMYATSADGIQWTKHGVIIDVLTPPFYWDLVSGQCVLKIGSIYHMWFSAGYWSGGAFTFWAQIYHATSLDGVSWDVTGVALPPNQAWDIGSTAYPWVVQDSSGLFWLFFSGWDGSNMRIGVATSPNGTSFTAYAGNPIVDLGPPGAWDSFDTLTSAVVPRSPWTMYFAGSDRTTSSLGIATSNDGLDWTRSPENPVYVADPAPSFDSGGLFGPMPLDDPTGPRLYFSGGDASTIQIGLFMNMSAYEPDGTYVSRVFDSGSRLTTWQSIHEGAAVPATTGLTAALRSGDAATPDSSWSDWLSVDASGSPGAAVRGRYVQYRLNLSSPSRTATPTVDDVTVTYASDAPPSATALEPAGANWVAAPTLRWMSVDPEGDSQTAFEVQLSRDSSFATIDLTSGPTDSNANQWTPVGLTEGTWYWRVRLSDGVAWGLWATSTFRVDQTPPALVVLVPTPGSVVPVRQIPVVWTVSDPYSGVDHVELQLDGANSVVLGSSASFYAFPAVPDGLHLVLARAVDAVGNAVSVSVPLTVDTVKPSIRITSPSPDTILTSSRVTLQWGADGTGSGIAGYELRLDHGDPINVSADQTSYIFANVRDGDHVVEVAAIDQAGNFATATLAFRVDTNVFSLGGPAGPWLDVALVGAAIAVAAIFTLRRSRRLKRGSGPPPGP